MVTSEPWSIRSCKTTLYLKRCQSNNTAPAFSWEIYTSSKFGYQVY